MHRTPHEAKDSVSNSKGLEAKVLVIR